MVDSRTPGLPSWCARTSSSQMLCANALARVTSCGIVLKVFCNELTTQIFIPLLQAAKCSSASDASKPFLDLLVQRTGLKHQETQHAT